jgi:aminoglycoside phosphotransferase
VWTDGKIASDSYFEIDNESAGVSLGKLLRTVPAMSVAGCPVKTREKYYLCNVGQAEYFAPEIEHVKR